MQQFLLKIYATPLKTIIISKHHVQNFNNKKASFLLAFIFFVFTHAQKKDCTNK